MLKLYVRRWKRSDTSQIREKSVSLYLETEKYIVRTVQREIYAPEISCLEQNLPLPKSSHILSLDPFLDSNHLLSIGGRLKHADIPLPEKHPLLIPGKHHIAKLLISKVHEDIQHQGRS